MSPDTQPVCASCWKLTQQDDFIHCPQEFAEYYELTGHFGSCPDAPCNQPQQPTAYRATSVIGSAERKYAVVPSVAELPLTIVPDGKSCCHICIPPVLFDSFQLLIDHHRELHRDRIGGGE